MTILCGFFFINKSLSIATEFTCPSGIENVQEGVKLEVELCDGFPDCVDESDELDEICCSDSSFKCKESENCINSIYECDGENDCDDGSDEQNCQAGMIFETLQTFVKKSSFIFVLKKIQQTGVPSVFF